MKVFQLFLSLILSCSFLSYTNGQSPVFHVSFNNDPDSTQTTELVSGTVFEVENQFSRPERIDGVNGQALRLDGHTTWAEKDNFSFSSIQKKLTIESWYATECFNAETVSILGYTENNSGFSLNLDPFGHVMFEFWAEGNRNNIRTLQGISPYEWHHIVAQVDLDLDEVRIYVDGQEWANETIDPANFLDLGIHTLYLGRRNFQVQANGFNIMVANGAIDEVLVYADYLTESTIQSRYQQGANVEVDLSIDPYVRHAGDYLRPHYHPMPNTSWANEAYGLSYYNGKYHLFFQKNPNHPALYFMHWGHMSSPDLVHWTEEKMTLRPQEGFASFGVWSGTTIFDEDSVPVISYTGVNGAFAGIGMAFPQDDSLIEWETFVGDPVIPRPPLGYNHMDFRDPYIWKEDTTYYMMVGSGLSNDEGGILFSYKSTDLLTWEVIDPVYERDDIFETGIFWEMPAFLQLKEDIWVLVVTPVYKGGQGAEVIYWVGEWNGVNFIPFHEPHKDFEHLTRNLLAPAFGIDENGEMAYIGIIPEDRDANLQIEAGWRQTFSLPRIIRLLDDDRLAHYPHPNLCSLREDTTEFANLNYTEGVNEEIPGVAGNQLEIEAKIVYDWDAVFSIDVFRDANASEFTSITFNPRIGRLGLDRRNSSPYATRKDNRFNTFYFGDTINLRIFLDHSTLEVFVDNTTAISARVYPGEASQNIGIRVEKSNINIPELRVYQLSDKEEESFAEIACTPDKLPNSYLTTEIETHGKIESDWKVYPNPSNSGIVRVECESCLLAPETMVNVIDIQGRVLFSGQFEPDFELNLNDFSDGLYFIQIQNESLVDTQKLWIGN